MTCEFDLCIYYSDGLCTVDEISINSLGMCDACVAVNIPESYLRKKRREVLERYEAEYRERDR